MKSRKDPNSLTDEETQFLRSERSAPAVRQFASRQHETMGVRISAYRKIAAAARAERDALMEIAALEVVRAASEDSATSRARVSELEAERRRLENQLEDTQRRLRVATAAPAIAVHSDGTGR